MLAAMKETKMGKCDEVNAAILRESTLRMKHRQRLRAAVKKEMVSHQELATHI